MLLGLPPLLLWVAASVLRITEGHCQPHTGSSVLALLAFLLWGAEIVWGFLGLLASRRRALAKALLFTLLLPLPLVGFLIACLALLFTLCLHLVF
jgi:hypothetical protein